MLINHSEKTIDQIVDAEGNPLVGEQMMFERIISDCTKSPLLWHMFYNLGLDIRVADKPRIEIDFLLACNKGIVVVEVKGGKIERRGGRYINFAKGKSRVIQDPFHQAEQYKWALFNNKVFSESEVIIATACAFPSTAFPTKNRPERLWAGQEHSSSASFADFCLDILEKEKNLLPFVLPDLSDNDLEKLLNRRLTASLFTSAFYSSVEIEDALDWLRIDDENTVESLIANDRLLFEGGPGTGKTTIAKTYIKHFPSQHGLYLCWNNMLAAKFEHKVRCERLGNCDVFTYGAYILKICQDTVSLDDLQLAGRDEAIRTKLMEAFLLAKASPSFVPYDYIILDEVHDYIDKGLDLFINEFSSFRGEGLRYGRFIAFYDREQGYANKQRELEVYARSISSFCTRYRLLDCRRVPTNKDIIHFSRSINQAYSLEDTLDALKEIEKTQGVPISIHRFRSPIDLIGDIQQRFQSIQREASGNDNILLTHSNIKRESVYSTMPMLNAIRSFAGPTPLTKDNVNEDFSHRWPTASILEYKGLECLNVTIVFSLNDYYDNYEMYIGLSRAIQSVTLLILDEHA